MSDSPVSRPSSNDTHLVIIDDEPGVLFALKLVLQSAGYQVTEFESAIPALEFIAGDAEIALVLCDLKMPKMDGLAALTEIKKLRPECDFVLMSGHATTSDIDNALKLGAAGYLSKPFTPDELKELLEQLEGVGSSSDSNDHSDTSEHDASEHLKKFG